MQQFKPYFMGEKDPRKDFGAKRLVSIQKCFRTSDIEEIGDTSHCTFFEMLGNFSINDYFKQEAIDLAWNFLTKHLDLDQENLWITYFKGDDQVEPDKESLSLWQKHVPKERIVGFGRQDNWWGPPGSSGPCGPCSEIHYDFTGQPCIKGSKCLPNCDCGRFMEVWNLVFTEFFQDEKKKLTTLFSKNIDTGMGLERLALILQKKDNLYHIDTLKKILDEVVVNPSFGSTSQMEDTIRARIITDHLRGTVFLLADGVAFSNKEQGYILRRIFRRALDQFLIPAVNIKLIVEKIIEIYSEFYPELIKNKDVIFSQIEKEMIAYQKIMQLDLQDIIAKISSLPIKNNENPSATPSGREISALEAFKLFTTYGISADRLRREGFIFNQNEFNAEIEKHQSTSRAGAQKKFGGHGLTSNEWTEEQRQKMTRLHTTTHLLHQALREVLGKHVRQQGSDIDPDRLRFDFEHPEKLTDEQKLKIENLINEKIKENLPVTKEDVTYKSAIDGGALAFFKEKYPEIVSVYSIGNFSKEVCGGPHVKNTSEIGRFKILSEKSSSAGIRRIKATVMP